jgi:hypothetical protein
MYVPLGTVDHWASVKSKRESAFEWNNLRFVESTVNCAKKPAWEGRLLDPYEVEEGWFEIHLPSLQLLIGDIPDPAARERAEFTIDKLHLRDGESVLRLRRSWLKMYETRELSLDGLRRMAPLVARAVERRDRRGYLTSQTS